MSKLYNVSSSPHVRKKLTTQGAMTDVTISLLPAAIFGVYHFGLHALWIILVSIIAAVLTECIFDYIAKKPFTVKDGSAVVTGLLLALCLPGGVPLYVPLLGSVFAILVVKCFFGGLGKNFMNPALAGRCFLLISFSGTVANYAVDGMSSATPLVDLAAGESVNLLDLFLGNTNGVIGCSIAALLIGGIWLFIRKGITIEIPAAALLSFALFIGLFGGRGFDPWFLAVHLCGGGIVMGAIFMATDPVTSPVSSGGQIIYGAAVGILSGVFRVFASAADSVSYAIIISNMLTPLIDEYCIPKPYGYRPQPQPGEKKSFSIPKPAITLCVITLIAGVCLSGVYKLTEPAIKEQQLAAMTESYQEVCKDATAFEHDDAISAAVEALGGEVYGTDFGKSYINDVVVGTDASGTVVGYVISVSSGDGYDGTITMSLGLSADGTINGLAFTEIHETAGMGMKCDEPAFKDQFAGRQVAKFTLNKSGGAASDEEINSVSGASVSSGAVVNAVNAALDFYAANIG